VDAVGAEPGGDDGHGLSGGDEFEFLAEGFDAEAVGCGQRADQGPPRFASGQRAYWDPTAIQTRPTIGNRPTHCRGSRRTVRRCTETRREQLPRGAPPRPWFNAAGRDGGTQPVQLGTAGVLPTQLFGVLALIGELVVVMVPPTR
jgi:hypothetical protein